jgi:hypothetical protein
MAFTIAPSHTLTQPKAKEQTLAQLKLASDASETPMPLTID